MADINGDSNSNRLVGTNQSDSIDGLGGDDTLLGQGGDDVLNGGDGRDRLEGGAGSDTMRGGRGNDTYVVESAGDSVIERLDEGNDTVEASISYTLTNNVENLTLTGSDAINGVGNGLDNQLIGNSANNALLGGEGNDFLDGQAGSDTLQGGNGGDGLVGGDGDDVLYGEAGSDALQGNSGNDYLDGGADGDSLVGGSGDDIYIVDNAGDIVSELAGEGNDAVYASVSYTASANVEQVWLTGIADINANGNAEANTLVGNSGNNTLSGGGGNDFISGGAGNDNLQGNDGDDTLDGGTGSDFLNGGLGNDTYVVDVPTDQILEGAGAGTDTVQASFSYSLGDNLENLTLTGSSSINGAGNALNNVITGNAASNTLSGNGGNDTLDGGAGADTLIGGTGNDTYVVDQLGDRTVENPGEGIDTVISNTSLYGLDAEIENLILGGSGNSTGIGNGLNNTILGNSGNNTLLGANGDDALIGGAGSDFLDGGNGADSMVGGIGDDSYVVDSLADSITEDANGGIDTVISTSSYTLSSNLENLTLSGTGNLDGTGNALDNTILGTSGNNTLRGEAGNDTLDAGAGNDTLDGGSGVDVLTGGTGDDLYFVDNSSDAVVEASNSGTDTVRTTASFNLTTNGANVETLILEGTGSINGTGNALDNTILGNSGNNALRGEAGNDTLDGSSGADAMAGGAGDDLYYFDNAGDSATENPNEGSDRVLANSTTATTFTIGDNVEFLTLLGTANHGGIGGNTANTILGNSGNNTLDGRGGDDTLQGGGGIDTLLGGDGNDSLDGGSGSDSMRGGAGNDTYTVDQAGDAVIENAAEGTDTILSAVTYTLGANLENLTLTGSGNLNGTGNSSSNILIGNSGDNTLDGQGGADVMQGGAGSDRYIVDDLNDTVTEAAGEGTDHITSSVSFTLGANVEDLTLVGTGNIDGTGNGLNNTITGNTGNNALAGNGGDDTLVGLAGNDTLDGGTGNDTMQGGDGNDTYGVDSSGDVVVETGTGIDTVQASISYSLSANLENLTLLGTANLDGVGNAADNIITGNSGNNLLEGGLGVDTLVGAAGDDTLNGGVGADDLKGGTGNDTYLVDDLGDRVTELAGEGTDLVFSSVSYTLGAQVENLTLIGTANLDGTGNALNNTILGNLGNNILDGGAGADTLQGGEGNDTYLVDTAGDRVLENANEGLDTIRSTVSFNLATAGQNVEDLVLLDGLEGVGNSLNNTITGNSLNNLLDGGTGADTLIGGAGDDRYIVDNAGDVLTENANEGIDTVEASISYTLSANLENLTLLGNGNLNGTGNDQANLIIGNGGNNALDGKAGADEMRGGSGDDTYIVDNAGDRIVENASEGTDTVLASLSYTLGANLENLTLTGTGNINGTGNSLNNTITGNSGSNILDGKAGADTLIGGDGNDTYVVDQIGDVVTELGTGNDTVLASLNYSLGANLENLTLTGTGNINGTGNSLNNTITGNSGNNILDGQGGNDILLGGAGDDTYIVDQLGEVFENPDEGTDTVQSTISYALGANLENLTLLGTGNINGTGNSLDNTITGNSGNNILDGQGGNDTLIGGAGNDTYVLDSTSDVITESLNDGIDTVQTNVSYTLGANLENLTLTGNGTINGTGNSLNNTITGNGFNNILDGQGGNDTLIGGAGNDTYIVDSSQDGVVESAGEGTDLVQASASYALSANVENLTLTGTANLNGTGNSSNNTIQGNSGNNSLDGGAGADVLIGGAGDDTYTVDQAGDVVTELANEGTDTVRASISYTLGTNLENLTLIGTATLNGTGNSGNNILTGNSAANLLDGAVGDDTMFGGDGDDVYVVESAGDVVVETVDQGIDTILSNRTFNLATSGANVENLTLTGSSNLNGTGNSLNNTIRGNSGNNLLDGGAGSDVLIGGAGDDTYILDTVGETVIENLGEGTDLVQSAASFTLSDHVENLTLTGTANIDGFGNGLDNIILGNSGSNTLDGGGGNDILTGGLGDDTYGVDSLSDVVTENANEGIDTVRASISYTLSTNLENLTLLGTADLNGTGNSLNNIITGNSGNNRLDGGTGADDLLGGLGNDTYVVDNAGDRITETGSGIDTVESNITYTLQALVENLTLTGTNATSGTGNSLNNIILGNAGNNTLTGGGGDDLLDGGVGADTLIGGTGNDTYIVEDGSDTIQENPGEGDRDEVQSSVTYTLANELENLTLTGLANINGTGNSSNNIILGNSGNNLLDGADGADQLEGGAGNDTYIVEQVGDRVVERSGEGTDTIRSTVSFNLAVDGLNVENLILLGTSGINGTGNNLSNTITGNSGNNRLVGGTGADTLIGGLGNDTYGVDNIADVVTEAPGEGTDLVEASVTYTLSANLENLTLVGSGDINGTGNGGNNILLGNSGINTLTGGAGDDDLDGGLGADTLVGNSGNDTYQVDDEGDRITEAINEGTDTVRSTTSFNLATNGANVENLVLLGTASTGIGNGLNNTITGNDSDNTLDGGAGSDRLVGGKGNDTYGIDSGSDVIVEFANEGTDTVNASITYTLADHLENLTLTGIGDINGTGNSSNNTLTGNDGNNTLDGGAGSDRLLGGKGNDTYLLSDTGDTVIENPGEGSDTLVAGFTLSLLSYANIENLTLTGSGNFNATGNALNNTLTGNSGNNTLDGGLGDDVMNGGAGDDLYLVDSTLDQVSEVGGSGIDTVRSSVSFTLATGVENLILTGIDNLNGTGNSGNNTLTGNEGNNTLNGGGGIDRLVGGVGDDIYITDGGDTIVELAGEGTDTVRSSANYVLTAELENLLLTGAAIEGTGNSVANVITGNDSNNILSGQGGDDLVRGDNGGDTLFGNEGDDRLEGEAGDDTLIGGIGNDTLVGGAGRDRLLYDTNRLFNTADIGVDTITGFTVAEDSIVLDQTTFTSVRGLVGSNLLRNDQFTLIDVDLTLEASTVAISDGYMVYNRRTGNLYYNANGDDAGLAGGGQFAKLTANGDLTASNFTVQL